jgi:hypothetical protein
MRLRYGAGCFRRKKYFTNISADVPQATTPKAHTRIAAWEAYKYGSFRFPNSDGEVMQASPHRRASFRHMSPDNNRGVVSPQRLGETTPAELIEASQTDADPGTDPVTLFYEVNI